MVKVAKTDEEKQMCFEYFKAHGVLPSTDFYIYYENGSVKAVAGLEVMIGDTSRKGSVDPFISDSLPASDRLFLACEWFLRGAGCTHIVCGTNHEEVKSMLEKLNFTKWSAEQDHYMKEL